MAVLESFSSVVGVAGCDGFTRGTTTIVSLCSESSTEGSVWFAPDGEAEAARSCSSILGAPVAGDGDDFAEADWTWFCKDSELEDAGWLSVLATG